MHLIVTGGAGYIGSRLTAHLLARRHSVTVIDRLDFGGEGLLGHLDNPRFKFIQADLHDNWPVIPGGRIDQERQRALDETQCIVHLAAIVGEDACQAAPGDARQTNVDATQRLADLNIPMVYVSTCSNYGRCDGMATEETPVNPLGLYAETKIEAEDAVLQAGGSVLRLATICGASPRMRFDLLVNDIARRSVENESISIYKPEAWRPFLHIADACKAISLLALYRGATEGRMNRAAGGIWNVVGENVQKGDLAKLAPGAWLEASDKDDPRDYRVSDAKFRALYRWEERRSIREAFAEVQQAVAMMPETQRRIYRNVA